MTEKVASTVVEHKVENVVEPIKSAAGGAVEKMADAAEGVADKADDLVEDMGERLSSDE